MARCFYRIPSESWEDANVDDAHVLHDSGHYVYLHSATDPNPALETLGAERFADDWQDLKNQVSTGTEDAIFRTQVERQEEVDGNLVANTLTIPRSAVRQTDTVLEDWLVPHLWAGDNDPGPIT